MGKRIIISEEERNHINKMYGFVNEQMDGGDLPKLNVADLMINIIPEFMYMEDDYDFVDNVISTIASEIESNNYSSPNRYQGMDYDEIYDSLRDDYTEAILNFRQ